MMTRRAFIATLAAFAATPVLGQSPEISVYLNPD